MAPSGIQLSCYNILVHGPGTEILDEIVRVTTGRECGRDRHNVVFVCRVVIVVDDFVVRTGQ